jgi:hypothetical protein
MKSDAKTIDEYLAALPDERREALSVVRQTIVDALADGFAEGMQYGMIGYFVPHSLYPAGYHTDPKQPLPFAALASQKRHMSIYLMGVYGDADLEKWFRQAWLASGKKLDMGKSCVRFKKVEDVALDVLAEAIARLSVQDYIERYEAARR